MPVRRPAPLSRKCYQQQLAPRCLAGLKDGHGTLPTLRIALRRHAILPEMLDSGPVPAHAMDVLHRDRLGLRSGRFSCGDGLAVENTAARSGTFKVTRAVRCVFGRIYAINANVPQLLDFIHALSPVGPGRRGDRAAAFTVRKRRTARASRPYHPRPKV